MSCAVLLLLYCAPRRRSRGRYRGSNRLAFVPDDDHSVRGIKPGCGCEQMRKQGAAAHLMEDLREG